MVPERSSEDTYTKALVKLHAAVYALRDKGNRQAATALELLVHKKWLTLAIELLSELKPPLSSESSLEATLCNREYEDVHVTLPPHLFSAPSLYDVDIEASGTANRGRSAGLEDLRVLSGPPALGSNIFSDLLCTSEGKSSRV